MCPKNEELTEECFQKFPLEFNTNKQMLQWNDGSIQHIKGTFITEGTYPPNSMWAMNPIPRINFDSHSSGQPNNNNNCRHPAVGSDCIEFDPPCLGDDGWYPVSSLSNPIDVMGKCSGDTINLSIVDYVKIPNDINEGDYILGWRWDCEQSPQVWNNCSDITIIKEKENKNKNIRISE